MKTAFPSTQQTCTLTLFSNIPFDNTYQHHSLISSLFKYNNTQIYNDGGFNMPPAIRFIARLKTTTGTYYPNYTLTGEYNFHFSNGLVGTVTLPLTPAQTNANYMEVKCGNDYYYYFITGIQQQNFETYTLSLELDVLMTYQDEFLQGMKDVPVMCARKHSHRFNSSGYPHCVDFKNSEDAFTSVKPTQTKTKTDLHLQTNLQKLEDVSWLYVCADADEDEDIYEYNFKNIAFPLAMFCTPMGTPLRFVVKDQNDVEQSIFMLGLSKGYHLINNGKVHGARLTHLPPIIDDSAVLTNEHPYSDYITIRSPNLHLHYESADEYRLRWSTDDYWLVYNYKRVPNHLPNLGFVIRYQHKNNFVHPPISLDINSVNNLTINSNRVNDPKLLFEPFKKYVLCSRYSEGNEFFPELLYSDYSYNSNEFTFETVATSYIGDNNIITYLKPIGNFYNYYPDLNIGMSSSMNYIVPCGTNALEVFNSTQSQSFYTSKVASGVTSGLTIAGGIGSTALGVASLVGSWGMSTPASVGLIAGGVGAIGSGIAGAVNTIKSASSKIEDLKNTPDSVNITGSNYCSDYGRVKNGLPYVVTYECSTSIKEMANDYFYEYGYNTSRDSYFNTELYYDIDSNACDNNLFGRTIFNYIQLQEDITNKINADIPLIAKQKLSSIFNNGITLWNFFGNTSLWGTLPQMRPTTTNNPDKWFMKHTLDNTEYSGS